MKNPTELAAEAIALHNVELRSLLLRLIDPEDLGHSVTYEVRQLVQQMLNRPRGPL
jgi:hypothetical protein